jgi:predicted NodU family carbamoyl transferase
MGSALYYYHQELNAKRSPAIYTACTGMRFTMKKSKKCSRKEECHTGDFRIMNYLIIVTDKLIEPGVVDGLMEGQNLVPGRLGGRSIIADPRNSKAKTSSTED